MNAVIPKDSTLAERQLLLYAAGTAARRESQRERAAALAAEVDWEGLRERLWGRKLLTVLGPRLKELAATAAAEGFGIAVEAALEASRRQSMLLDLVLVQMTAGLTEAEIPSAPLKGPRLSEAIYGDPGRRLSSDIDLLVPPERLRDAVAVAEGLGYAPPADHTDADGMPQLHFALPHDQGAWPPVELHWRIHWYETRFAAEQLLPPRAGLPEWQPRPVAGLTALLLFYARDGFIDLRLASDVAAWWDSFGTDIAPGELAALLGVYPALRRVVGVSARVAEEMVGLPAQRLLAGGQGLGVRGRLARRLANPNPHGSQAQLYADRGMVDALVSPPGGFGAFVRREVFPPLEVRAEHARIAGREHTHSSLGRGAGMLARYGFGLRRFATRPETWQSPSNGFRPSRNGSGATIPTVRLMGMEVAAVDEATASRRVVEASGDGRGVWAVTANLDHLRRFQADEGARELIEAADLVVADGTPLVWASRLAGSPLPDRVAGSDMIWTMAAEAARLGRSVYLLGGVEGVADRAAAVLAERHAELRIAGTYCPPFGFEDDPGELRRIEQAVTAAAPGLVLIGLGFPKQDLLIKRLRPLLPGASFVGVGASFDFVAGTIPRAPTWMQRLGVEWLYRLAQEPRRLVRRYLLEGVPFALRLLAAAARHRLAPRPDDGWGGIQD